MMDKETRKQTILEMFQVLNTSMDDDSIISEGTNAVDGILGARLNLRKYFDKKDNTSYHHEFYQKSSLIKQSDKKVKE